MSAPHNFDPGKAVELHNQGVQHDQAKEFAQAADCYRRSIAANPDQLITRRSLASLLLDLGEHDESRELYASLIAANPDDVDAHYAYSKLTKYQRDDATITALHGLSEKISQLPFELQVKLCFTLGKANQDIGEYAGAFEAFEVGNELHYERFPYDEASHFAMLDDVQKCVDAALMARQQPPAEGDCTPIFVLGMPRTGSTLVEQMLASHSEVSAGGELKYLKESIQEHLIGDRQTFSAALPHWTNDDLRATAKDYIDKLQQHANGRRYVVDKMPGNFAFIGLIASMFPNAKVVHTVRHPMATLWSNYSTLFGDALHYTYRLDVLERYFARYREMMGYWRSVLPDGRIFDLEYEHVVRSPKEKLEELLRYLELSFEPACLDFHKTQREVRTASVAQVRQPLYATAIDLWRNYEAQLRPRRTP